VLLGLDHGLLRAHARSSLANHQSERPATICWACLHGGAWQLERIDGGSIRDLAHEDIECLDRVSVAHSVIRLELEAFLSKAIDHRSQTNESFVRTGDFYFGSVSGLRGHQLGLDA